MAKYAEIPVKTPWIQKEIQAPCVPVLDYGKRTARRQGVLAPVTFGSSQLSGLSRCLPNMPAAGEGGMAFVMFALPNSRLGKGEGRFLMTRRFI